MGRERRGRRSLPGKGRFPSPQKKRLRGDRILTDSEIVLVRNYTETWALSIGVFGV